MPAPVPIDVMLPEFDKVLNVVALPKLNAETAAASLVEIVLLWLTVIFVALAGTVQLVVSASIV